MRYGLNKIAKSTLLSVALIGALALTACGAEGAGPESEDGEQIVRVAYVPTATALPVFVAQEGGIFAKNGLKVELQSTFQLGAMPPLLGKQLDMSLATAPDLLKAASQGIDVVAVAGLAVDTTDNQQVQVLVRADSDINSAADLEGKTIAAASVGSVMHLSTLNWLADAGLDPKSVNVVSMEFPSMADQLKAGRIDAAELIEPFVSQTIAQEGYRSLGDPVLSVGDDVPFSFWIASREWAVDNTSSIDAWTKSLEEATELIAQDDAMARRVLADYTELPLEVAEAIQLPEYRSTITPAELEVWIDPVSQYGGVEIDAKASDLVVTGTR